MAAAAAASGRSGMASSKRRPRTAGRSGAGPCPPPPPTLAQAPLLRHVTALSTPQCLRRIKGGEEGEGVQDPEAAKVVGWTCWAGCHLAAGLDPLPPYGKGTGSGCGAATWEGAPQEAGWPRSHPRGTGRRDMPTRVWI